MAGPDTTAIDVLLPGAGGVAIAALLLRALLIEQRGGVRVASMLSDELTTALARMSAIEAAEDACQRDLAAARGELIVLRWEVRALAASMAAAGIPVPEWADHSPATPPPSGA